MKEQTLSPAERCPALSVDSKPLGVLDVRIGHLRPRPPWVGTRGQNRN